MYYQCRDFESYPAARVYLGNIYDVLHALTAFLESRQSDIYDVKFDSRIKGISTAQLSYIRRRLYAANTTPLSSMSSKHQLGPLQAFIGILVAVLVVTGTVINWRYDHTEVQKTSRRYTYHGLDHPQTWDIPKLNKVKMAMENSVHYDIDTELGIAEWNATMPSGGGMLYLGDDLRPFSISMFHQLRCLNILREEIVTQSHRKQKNPSALAHHCMNYVRQMILCRANFRLESVRRPGGMQVTDPYVTHTCNDWTAVYDAAEQNYEEFLRRFSKDPLRAK
ncbi:hypothetical protein FPV67DRAFT_854450 [Lyophyllum atratum]|nr:hypothetical protein FPV67DRAFT_854450 [Lyophyllum atratum]